MIFYGYQKKIETDLAIEEANIQLETAKKFLQKTKDLEAENYKLKKELDECEFNLIQTYN